MSWGRKIQLAQLVQAVSRIFAFIATLEKQACNRIELQFQVRVISIIHLSLIEADGGINEITMALPSRSNRASQKRLQFRVASFVVIGAMCAVGTFLRSSESTKLYYYNYLTALSEESVMGAEFSPAENARRIKEWRQSIRTACDNAKNPKQVREISDINKDEFHTVSNPWKTSSTTDYNDDDSNVIRCKNVVMDFGANIGDTSGHVIDSGMVGCEKRFRKKIVKTPKVHFNIETKEFEDVDKRNPLTRQLVKLMLNRTEEARNTQSNKAEIVDVGPEDYCYYGIEGNPTFTERLQRIEEHVMKHMSPRPLQHMHFFTESVGSGEDGPTKLYLDTVNTKENFWGSSIFKDHQDVKKSAETNNQDAEQLGVPVTGYTIGTLMRKTLLAFDENASEADKKGGHLLLKVDIEGGEYPLLAQAVEEGTLCEFAKNNQADLYFEFHSQRVTGKHEWAGKLPGWKRQLTKCGVTFRDLDATWA